MSGGPSDPGASYVTPPGGSWYRERSYSLPCWLLASLTGAWPLTSLALHLRRRTRKHHRTRTGRCLQCGYDLRAIPQSDAAAGGALLPICPECGTAR